MHSSPEFVLSAEHVAALEAAQAAAEAAPPLVDDDDAWTGDYSRSEDNARRGTRTRAGDSASAHENRVRPCEPLSTVAVCPSAVRN